MQVPNPPSCEGSRLEPSENELAGYGRVPDPLHAKLCIPAGRGVAQLALAQDSPGLELGRRGVRSAERATTFGCTCSSRARAWRISETVSPPLMEARIGANSVLDLPRASSPHDRTRSVAARNSKRGLSCRLAISIAFMKCACACALSDWRRLSSRRPFRRCSSASQKRSPDRSTKPKPSSKIACAPLRSSIISKASAS